MLEVSETEITALVTQRLGLLSATSRDPTRLSGAW